jgi:hypothetical protein
MENGKLVYIQRVATDSKELTIAKMMSEKDIPSNHCVPVLDCFVDDEDSSISYIVMPLLLPYNQLPFETVGEIVDFVDQLLEVC